MFLKKKQNRPFSLTVRPTELKKETAILLCHNHLDFKLYSLPLQCTGYVQSKNGVDLVEVSIYYKLMKTSGQTVWPKKIKALPCYGHLVFLLFL